MNKKVKEHFKYINDIYLLQCLCSEQEDEISRLNSIIYNAIVYIEENCIDDEFYINLTYKEKSIFEILKILKGGK